MIRRSPIHSLKQLESLVQLLGSNIQHRRDALAIADILEDIFSNIYLPDNRRLLFLHQQATQPTTKVAAMLAFVEDTVKQLYLKFIDALQVCDASLFSKMNVTRCFLSKQIAHDPIGPIRLKAVAMLQRLLTKRPEQEKRLLELIVDKLGDPDSTVAAKTLHLLNQLCKKKCNDEVLRQHFFL